MKDVYLLKGERLAGQACSAASTVRSRVILPLAAAMTLLVVVFISIFVLEARQRQSEDIAHTATEVEALFRAQSTDGVQTMRSVMELLMRDRRLEAAFQARDRNKLFVLSEPILNDIRARNRITHFYYILPDRTMFLRVQVPDKFGDRIDRIVLREAQRTGKPFWGNEQGPFGSLTLRVNYPWFSDGKLLGYLEMGIEFEDIMQVIHQMLDATVFVAVHKQFLDRNKWESMKKRTGHRADWDEFPSVIVLSRTRPEIPAPIAAYMAGLREPHDPHAVRSFETAWEGRVAQTVVLPFTDLRGRELGELVVLRDVTAATVEHRQAVVGVAVLGVVIGGALMVFFYVLLGRVQRDVMDRRLAEAEVRSFNEELERKVEERTRQLLESKARFRRLVDANIIGVVFWRLDGTLDDANDAFLDIVGYSREDLRSGKISWTAITPPEFRAVDEEAAAELRATGSCRPFEKQYLRQDGRRVSVLIGGALFEGSKDRGVAFVLDLTERKQLEQQLSRRLHHLDVMERISRISLNSENVEELLERALDEILSVFNADRAWFLYPCDPDAPSWSVPMERTRPEWPGAFARGAVMPTTPDVAAVFRELLTSTDPLPYGPAASRNIPATVAEEFSIRSQIQMALRPREGSPWVMGLHHCAQAHAYSEDELLIFRAIGQRVADALSSLIILKNLRESTTQLVAAQEELVRIVTSISDYLWSAEIDANGNMTYLYCSPVVEDITGRPPEFYMQSPDRWLSTVHEEDRPRLFQALQRIATGKSEHEMEEYRVNLPDGSTRWVRDSAKVTRLAGGRARVNGVVSDISAYKQAATDSLTGIANRRMFERALESEIARSRRYDMPFALIMCDVDHFKEVNDAHGHDVGDGVLRGITQIMQANIRAVDLLARWGGEEFVVLSPQSSVDGVSAMADKLRAAIADQVFNEVRNVTASFGIAMYEPGDDAASLLKKADEALYKAKQNGRNRVEAVIERP